MRDVRLNLRQRARRRLLAVEVIGETVDRYDPIRVQQEDREHRSFFRSAEPKRARLVDDLEWSQDPELEQARTVAAS